MHRNRECEAEKRQKQLQIQRLCALDIYPKVLKVSYSIFEYYFVEDIQGNANIFTLECIFRLGQNTL